MHNKSYELATLAMKDAQSYWHASIFAQDKNSHATLKARQ